MVIVWESKYFFSTFSAKRFLTYSSWSRKAQLKSHIFTQWGSQLTSGFHNSHNNSVFAVPPRRCRSDRIIFWRKKLCWLRGRNFLLWRRKTLWHFQEKLLCIEEREGRKKRIIFNLCLVHSIPFAHSWAVYDSNVPWCLQQKRSFSRKYDALLRRREAILKTCQDLFLHPPFRKKWKWKKFASKNKKKAENRYHIVINQAFFRPTHLIKSVFVHFNFVSWWVTL